jgi:uridine phosphorylase
MLAPMPLHLKPTAPIASDALLPGDPGRAMALAQMLFADTPKMSNHNRGLWGYWGETPAGRPLTIQATGIGGPSATLVLQELAELGVRRAIRVGTCGAVADDLELGDLVIAHSSLALDGASRRLQDEEVVPADPVLTEGLAAAAGVKPSLIATVDLFYDPDPNWRQELAGLGAKAVEMEAASLFALGRRLEVAVACVLAVTDVFDGDTRGRISDEDLAEAVPERLGRAAVAALESPASNP